MKIINNLRALKSILHFAQNICLFAIIGATTLTSAQTNSRIWTISQDSSWEDLKLFLPKAKMDGISVWVYLMPPTKSPPVCSSCSYSEPFRLDFIRWAEEIARLSLRYSNVKGYAIEDYQENINLGYFTQNYIDTVVATAKSINPKIQFSSIDITPPSAPASLIATSGINKITLEWINPTATDLAKIYVYRASTTNPTVLIDSINANVQTYLDTPLTAGSIYFYRLKARDNSFNYSVYSSNVSATLNSVTDNTTNWYVDRDAAGDGSGSDWINAATSLTSLNWTPITAGDTIYVSGGITSKTYDRIMLEGKGVDGGVIVITNGKDAGHNGEVIFSPSNSSNNYTFRIKANSKNIKLTGITFNCDITAGINNGAVVSLSQVTNIQIDNCHIKSNGSVHGINAGGCTSLEIINSIIETTTNNYTYEQDGIIIGQGGGGHTITGNTITLRGTNASPHKDCIQFWGNEGLNNNYQTVIANNLFIQNSSGITNVQGLYISGVYANRFLVYNNIFLINGLNAASAVSFNHAVVDTAYNLSLGLYNNTVITGSANQRALTLSYLDTLTVKNNIFMNDAGGSTMMLFADLQGCHNIDFDYNQYFRRGAAMRIDTTAKGVPNESVTWAGWQALGYDAHSDTGTVSFANIWGTTAADHKLTDGSIGIDDGTAISIFYTDIEGTLRPRGASWDKGALER